MSESGALADNLIASEWDQWGEEGTIELTLLRRAGKGSCEIPLPCLTFYFRRLQGLPIESDKKTRLATHEPSILRNTARLRAAIPVHHS